MSTTKTPKKRDIVNRTGGVVTDDGRTLYGFDAEIFVKVRSACLLAIKKAYADWFVQLKGKEDPEWQTKVGHWLETVVGIPLEDPNDLWVSLKDGIFLIKYVVGYTFPPSSIFTGWCPVCLRFLYFAEGATIVVLSPILTTSTFHCSALCVLPQPSRYNWLKTC